MAFSKPRRSARKVQTGRKTGAFKPSESFSAPDEKTSAAVRRAASAANSKNQPDGAEEFLFQHAVALAVSNARLEDKLDADHPHELLVPLDYADECRVKTDAVRSFWQVHGLPAQLVPAIVPSPVPRGYRATSKRRVYVSRGGQLRFCMGYGAEREETLRSVPHAEPEQIGRVHV